MDQGVVMFAVMMLGGVWVRQPHPSSGALQPMETDPMLNFDELDLIAHVELVGLREIHPNLEVDVKPQ